jgi:NADPH2:quinone reductase
MNLPVTQVSIEITHSGDPDVLQACQRQIPVPNDKQILIEVAAAGVNRPDVFQRLGFYPPPPSVTDIP